MLNCVPWMIAMIESFCVCLSHLWTYMEFYSCPLFPISLAALGSTRRLTLCLGCSGAGAPADGYLGGRGSSFGELDT